MDVTFFSRGTCYLSTGSPRQNDSNAKADGRVGDAREGLVFLEIQRDLLLQLEGLFVTMADDR